MQTNSVVPHRQSAEEVVAALGPTLRRSLNEAEIRARLEKYGRWTV